jgi:hypothetical protein
MKCKGSHLSGLLQLYLTLTEDLANHNGLGNSIAEYSNGKHK